MNEPNKQYDVFLSYNSLDRLAVELVAEKLTNHGLSVFLDRWYLVPGTSWQEHLEQVLISCRSVVIFIGPSGFGSWQFREQQIALDRQVKDSSLTVIPTLLPGADPPLGFIRLNTWIDLRIGLNDEKSIGILSSAIQGKPPADILRRTEDIIANICPYRGLRFFREEDAPFFFGRNTFINKLEDIVQQHSMVAVVGASGSGKSSVVRAGLIPRLRQNKNNIVWDILTIVPGDKPTRNLAAALLPLLEPDMTEVDRLREIGKLTDGFQAKRISLRDVVSRIIVKQKGTNRLMLVVDQFEELYTLTLDKNQQQLFLDELLDATQSDSFSVIITVRADFYGHLLKNTSLFDRIKDAKVDITGMKREELRAVIELPAREVNLRIDPNLVERLLDKVETQPGKLPLLEFALTELWKKRKLNEISTAAYNEIGEIEGAIAKHADDAYKKLTIGEQEITRQIFLQLIRLEVNAEVPDMENKATRRRAYYSEFSVEALSVIRKLANAHLLVTSRNEATGEETVDIVHEALIEEWDILTDWMKENYDFLVWRERIRAFMNLSHLKGNVKRMPLEGASLEEAHKWMRMRRSYLNEKEIEYINDSSKAKRNKYILYAIGSVALFIIIFFIIYSNRNEASSQVKDDNELEAVIVQVNDVYEIAPISGGKEGGLARVATLKKQFLQSNNNTFLIMAGDFLSPSFYNASMYRGKKVRGRQMVEAMNAAGVDFAIFGNHEFDLNESELAERINESDFQWISSNVFNIIENDTLPFYKTSASGKSAFPEYFIKEITDRDGTSVRIGFIALTIPINRAAYVFYADPLSTAKRLYNKVKDSVDAVVAITHQSLEDDVQLAKELPGLALIIGGHEHDMSLTKVGNVFISKAHANAKSAYVIKLKVNRTKKNIQVVPSLKYLNDSIPLDPNTDNVVQKWMVIMEMTSTIRNLGLEASGVGYNGKEPLDPTESKIRAASTNYTKLLVSAIANAAPAADVVLLNAGSIRIDYILQPPVAIHEIFNSLPFGGGIREADMKGRLLLKVLNQGRMNTGTGGFLHYNENLKYDASANSWKLNNREIDSLKTYRVAMPEFLLSGLEVNLRFLQESNPDIIRAYAPETNPAMLKSDIRLAFIRYLMKLNLAKNVPAAMVQG